jgi:large subunit ribosomal protein L10
MLKPEKEKIVAELTERLRSSETLIVADYRGLSVNEVDELRTKLLEHGAGFTVVKNSLTRRAAEAAGAEALLALLDGPSAIAFLQAGGDPVAVAKALADSARTTKILAVRGGLMQGRTITAEEIEELAKLPPLDVLRGQVLGAVASPVYTIVGLFTAPLRDLHGLVQARIDQLGGESEIGQPDQAPEPEEPKAEVVPETTETENNPADSSQNDGEAVGLESANEETAEQPASEEEEA